MRPCAARTLVAICAVGAVLRATQAHELQRLFPGLTRGEGVLESHPAGIEPVRGTPPERPRTTASPLDLDAYLAELAGRR